MATVKELIEYLQTLPPEDEVVVLQEKWEQHAYSASVNWVTLNLPVDGYSNQIEHSVNTVWIGEND